MMALDAFRAFDANRNGTLGCSEMYGGLTWLGLEIVPEEIYELVKIIDSDHDGRVSLQVRAASEYSRVSARLLVYSASASVYNTT